MSGEQIEPLISTAMHTFALALQTVGDMVYGKQKIVVRHSAAYNEIRNQPLDIVGLLERLWAS